MKNNIGSNDSKINKEYQMDMASMIYKVSDFDIEIKISYESR